MAPNPPLWLKVVHRVERTIGGPVESAVHSDRYFDAVTLLNRARARAGRVTEALSSECLHLLNLPAGSDIRRVREQLSRMERRLTRLTDEVAELELERGRR